MTFRIITPAKYHCDVCGAVAYATTTELPKGWRERDADFLQHECEVCQSVLPSENESK